MASSDLSHGDALSKATDEGLISALPQTDKTLILLCRYSDFFLKWIRTCLILLIQEPLNPNDIIGIRFDTNGETKMVKTQQKFLIHIMEILEKMCGIPEGKKVGVVEVSGKHILVYVCREDNPILNIKVFSKNGKNTLTYSFGDRFEKVIKSGPHYHHEKVKRFLVSLEVQDSSETVPELSADDANWVKGLYTSINSHNDYIKKLISAVEKKEFEVKEGLKKQLKELEIQRRRESALEDGFCGLFGGPSVSDEEPEDEEPEDEEPEEWGL